MLATAGTSSNAHGLSSGAPVAVGAFIEACRAYCASVDKLRAIRAFAKGHICKPICITVYIVQ
jgi:hypothetical protein